jgi:hypothetical protein
LFMEDAVIGSLDDDSGAHPCRRPKERKECHEEDLARNVAVGGDTGLLGLGSGHWKWFRIGDSLAGNGLARDRLTGNGLARDGLTGLGGAGLRLAGNGLARIDGLAHSRLWKLWDELRQQESPRENAQER